MNLKNLITIFTLFLLLLNTASADVSKDEMASALTKDLTHPYLFFTEDEKPAILERIKNDPASKSIFDKLTAEANRLLYTPVEPLPPQAKTKGPQLFDNTGGEFIRTYYSYRTAAYNLAFVYQMTGDQAYAEKAFEFARELCDMPNWVYRAHQFPIVYGRTMPWNVSDDQVMFNYEIVTSDTAAMLACAYDWLYPALSTTQRDWIRGGLMSKAVSQVRGNWDFHWWATAYRCNWCAWCCNGLGLAALAMLTESPQLVDVVAESFNRITKTYDEVGVDGGWAEGGSYWSHTFSKPMRFNAALAKLTDGEYNLYHHPKYKDNPVNFPLYLQVPPRQRVNFADSGSGGHLGSRQLMNKIAIETGNREAAWLLQNLYGKPSDIFDIIWPDTKVKGKLPKVATKHFRTVGWAVMRSDFTDPEKVVIACKAGYNDDPHHGHLDVGQFMVYWRGQAYIRDLGTAEYDELYFGPEKYDTPHADSRGHNLIFVNGEQQVPGKLKGKPFDETIGGEILEFRPSKSRDYTLMDPTNAYPGKHIKGWRRHIILEKPEITVVLDEVSAEKGAEIEARFHSECTQTAKDGYTLIKGKEGTMALIPVIAGDFSFRPGRHAYQAIFKKSTFRWIPYNGTVVEARAKDTVLAHIILPVEDDTEAEAIVKSVKRNVDGNRTITLAFEKAGESYRYSFEKTGEGLVLK
jgi:hypothetical protein